MKQSALLMPEGHFMCVPRFMCEARIIHKKRTHQMMSSFLCWRYLFSQSVTRQLSSANLSLTSVFGMGTGGPSCQSTPIKKSEPEVTQALCWHYLFSRPVTRQVSSTNLSLTSVFGMGTGGPSPQSAPTIY